MPSIESMGFQLEYAPHPSSGCGDGETQAQLDSATTVAELDRAWRRLERRGEVDAWGGAEYRHALSHLYFAHPEMRPPESAGGEPMRMPVRAKWVLDGASSLTEAAQKARDLASWLQDLDGAGYVLEGEIADDYGMAVYKP